MSWNSRTRGAAARGEQPKGGSPSPANEEFSSSGSHTSVGSGDGGPPLAGPPPGEDQGASGLNKDLGASGLNTCPVGAISLWDFNSKIGMRESP
ncbi:unnamed protein product [Lampetra fluviatilis]